MSERGFRILQNGENAENAQNANAISHWREGFEQRRRDAYRAAGFPEDAIAHLVTQMRRDSDSWTVAKILSHTSQVGFVVVSVNTKGTPTGHIRDVWIDPAHAGQGHERAARAWAEGWCLERGAIGVSVRLMEPNDLFSDYPLRGQTRIRVLSGPRKVDKATVRPMTEAEYPEWLEGAKSQYVDDIVAAGALSPEEARAKSDKDFAELLPGGLATPDNTFQVFEDKGAVIGMGWLKHHYLPYVTFGYSLEIREAYRGTGYGSAAMALGEHAILASGDTMFMFNVFGGNALALSIYDKVGYKVVEETRSIDLPVSSPGGTF